MQTLNLGILAHVDAGKTTLTERLLHDAGVIDELGSVDDGSTQTDTLTLERRRGITIRAAVVAFAVGDVAINLIDTPGHPDFIAEVDRVLGVLDGAVLVVSAVEGVQAQTRILMRALQRLRLPTLIFVNKLDRAGADADRVLAAVAERLTPAVVPMWRDLSAEALAERDDALLADYLDGAAIGRDRLRAALAVQSRAGRVHPVFRGSAISGDGIGALTAGLTELLPRADGDPDGPVAGQVFKVERGAAGEKRAYVRMRSGTIAVRDRIPFGDGHAAKVTAIDVFESGDAVPRPSVAAGRIGRLGGLADVRVGDVLGEPGAQDAAHFAPPTLETVVLPRDPGGRRALHLALTRLAEQDPLIGVRLDDDELAVSLYGEVQKQVIEATLAEEFGVAVAFRETTTICVERPAGRGAAHEVLGAGSNPFLATVGLRVEPAPENRFGLEVELGSMPSAFFAAVEETVAATLRQGLHGWAVTGCAVTMTHSGYAARQSSSHGGFDKSMSSTAGDFRELVPPVLMTALARAGTEVLEPLHRFRLELPAGAAGAVLAALARLFALPSEQSTHGAWTVIEGLIPAAQIHALERRLPSLTGGEGLLESAFDRHEPVRGAPPERARTGRDPLDRREYLGRARQ